MASTDLIVIGFIIGVIAYLTVYLGKGIQKYAIEGFKEEKGIKKKNTGIWIFGTILTTIYLFIQWLAIYFAPVNIIAPLEGIGLITLIIFSYYILKEEITQKEIVGIILIIIGTILITLFNLNITQITISDFIYFNYVISLVIVAIVAGVGVVICILSGYKGAGFIIGAAAGSCMALQTVSKRLIALPDPTIDLISIIIVMIFAVLSLGVTQLAFAKAKANRVLPCFASVSIILATLVGAFTLSELIHFVQIIGIAIMVTGIVFLTAFRKEEEKLK